MAELEQAAPSADEGVSLDTAVERLDKDAGQQRQEQPEQQSAQQAEPSGEQQPQTEPEQPEPSQEVLHGNARTRLRDGTEVTLAELKKAYGERQDFHRQRNEFDTQKRAFDDREAKIKQQESFLQQAVAQATAVVQARMPKAPDVSLRETDPFTYYQKMDDYNREVAELQRLHWVQEAQTRQAEIDKQQRQQQFLQAEQAALVDRIPELKTSEGMQAFRSDANKHGSHYGFSAEELGGITDHRMLVVLKDAIAWRKLQEQKPAALDKAKDAAPVQQPGPRRSGTERTAQQREEGMARLRKTGRLEDALAVLNSG